MMLNLIFPAILLLTKEMILYGLESSWLMNWDEPDLTTHVNLSFLFQFLINIQAFIGPPVAKGTERQASIQTERFAFVYMMRPSNRLIVRWE